jgi:hypothetical protein
MATGLPRSAAVDASAASTRKALSDWPEYAVAFVDRHWRWGLALLILLSGTVVLYMGRGLGFFFDDWDFVTHDYGGGVHSLLVGHGGNLVLFPVLVYKALFHLAGLDHYAAFRLVVLLLHLACGVLVFVLASRRVSHVNALLAAALIMFLGAAWEDLLWAFQITYLLSVAGGLGAWVLIERDDRLGAIAAMVCLGVAIGSSSLGIALAIGVAVELLWRGRWRSGWIVLLPAILYVIWYLNYGESQITRNGLINAPGFAEDLAAAAFGGLVGRALEWGRPLALLGSLLVLWRLARRGVVSARLAGLLATGVGLWAITAVARSTISQPEASRYVYLGTVVIVLTGVELMRGVTVAPRVTVVAALVVGFCVLTGLTVLHTGATSLRATSQTVTAELGALELASANAPPSYQPDPQRAPQIMAGPYLHTVHAIGSSPADSPSEIAAADPASREAADVVLVALGEPRLTPLTRRPHTLAASAPALSRVVSGSAVDHGACVDLTPSPASSMIATLVVPTGGVRIEDRGVAPVSVGYRRFGEAFDSSPAAVQPHAEAELSFAPDAASVPWQLEIGSTSSVDVCGLQLR